MMPSLSESKSYSEAKIVALFEKYKDDSEDFILSEGIEEFCIDLQLKPDEFKVLGERPNNHKHTFHEARPMDVETDWLGAIKQSLEGSSDHSP